MRPQLHFPHKFKESGIAKGRGASVMELVAGREQSRKRILFVAEACTLAHVIRPLVLANTLDPALYDVHFACDKTDLLRGKEFIFEGTNFTHWDIKSLPSATFLEHAASGAPLYDFHTLEAYAEEELRLIETIDPDFIIGDMRWSLSVSAEYRHVPYASISNMHWNTHAEPFLFPLPEFPAFRLLAGLFGEKLVTVFAERFIKPGALRAHASGINHLRENYDLPQFTNVLEAISAAPYMLYADLPQVVAAPGLPATHHYLGPITWEPHIAKPEWWDRIPADKPIVYVALGSSGKATLLPEILARLKKHPVTVIAAAPERFSDEQVFASPFFPWGEAAKRSVLMIGNGGTGSVYQALEAGVPLLGIVANQDQVMTMAHVERQGFGTMLRASMANGTRIHAAITTLLNQDNYKARAQELQRTMASHDYRQLFPDFMQTVLSTEKGRALPGR